MGEQVDAADVLFGRLVAEIDGLRDRVVGVSLKLGLHADVPFGRDVVGSDKEPGDVFRYPLHIGERFLAADLGHELLGVEAALARNLLEEGMDFEHLLSIEYATGEHYCEQWLNTGGSTRDYGEGAGGRDGSDGGVAEAHSGLHEDALVEVGEDSPLGSDLGGGIPPALVEEAHDAPGDFERGVGVVGNAELNQEVRKPHHAEAYLAVGACHLLDLLEGVFVHVDDIVQEAHGSPHGLAEALVVDLRGGAGEDEAGEVDGPEVTGFVGQQRLLAAGVSGLDVAQGGGWIHGVEAVQEDDPRLAGLPGALYDQVEDLAGGEPLHHLPGTGVDEVVLGLGFECPHEVLGEPDGNIEVGEDRGIALGSDELEDVRVIDPQDGHVGAAAGAALLDGLGGGVENSHERNGAGGAAAGGADDVSLGPEAGEREASAAAGLMDESGVLDGLEDGCHRVFDGKHKAGGELLELSSGVHEGGRVGEELQAGDEAVEVARLSFHIGPRVIALAGRGDVPSNAPEHLPRLFERYPIFALAEVAIAENGEGIVGELRQREVWRQAGHSHGSL